MNRIALYIIRRVWPVHISLMPPGYRHLQVYCPAGDYGFLVLWIGRAFVSIGSDPASDPRDIGGAV